MLVNSAGILMSGSVETLAVADYDKVRIAAAVSLNPIFFEKFFFRQWQNKDLDQARIASVMSPNPILSAKFFLGDEY